MSLLPKDGQFTVLAADLARQGPTSSPVEARPDGVSLFSPLGEGGMAVVWSGTQRSLARTVAVKVARRTDAADQIRLLKEAKLTARLEHPNIVPVHDVVVSADGYVQVLMKRLSGDRWSLLMADATAVQERFGADLLDWNLAVLAIVGRAVAFAHDHGIIHRDIKPANVMVGPHGEVALLDWGVAASWADSDDDLPQLEDVPVAGTLAYMAPEQLEGDSDTQGPWTDVFLLGATLHQLLSGAPPFASVDPGAARSYPRSRVRPELSSTTPPELRDLVEVSLAVDVAERLVSADDFATRIERFRKHRGSASIAERARQRLESGDPGDVPLAEAEVGFRAALEIWPENPVATAGLRQVAHTRVRRALDRGLPELAVDLLAQDPDAAGPLREQVDGALRAKQMVQRRADEALQQADVTFDAPRRRLLVLLLGPVWPVGWASLAVGSPQTVTPLTLFLGAIIVVGAVAVLWQGIPLLGSQAHRTNVLGATVTLVLSLGWALACARLELAPVVAYLGVMLVQTATLSLVGLVYDRRALAPAVVAVVCVTGAAAFPGATAWLAAALAAGVLVSTAVQNGRATRASR